MGSLQKHKIEVYYFKYEKDEICIMEHHLATLVPSQGMGKMFHRCPVLFYYIIYIYYEYSDVYITHKQYKSFQEKQSPIKG